MTSRCTLWRAASLLLLLATGCLFPVGQKIDLTLCDIAKEPRDSQQPLPQIDETPMPPAANGAVKSAGYAPAGKEEYVLTGGALPLPTPEITPRTPTATAERLQRYPLMVPPDLLPLGTGIRTIHPPRRQDFPSGEAGYEAYQTATRTYYKTIFPPLPPLGSNPKAELGPMGHPMTLADLQKFGLEHSPQIKQAIAYVEAMRGAAVQAGLPPNPVIGFEGDTFGTTGGAGYEGAYVDQLIKTANKLQLARAVATMDLRNAEVALRRAQMDLATRIRSGYFAVLVARESMRVNLALTSFTRDLYNTQVLMLQTAFLSAPSEAMYLGVLTFQAQTALVQARNHYVSAWNQLAAALGVPGMNLTQLQGRVDMPLPVFDYKAVLARVLSVHTDVMTADNSLQQSRFSLALARVTPIPDVDVRFLLQKDYTGLPFELAGSVQVSVPVPIWNRNQGGIVQAEANVVQMSEEPHRARTDLTTRLADAFERYETFRTQLQMYRDYMVRNQAAVYQAAILRYRHEGPTTTVIPGTSGTPGFTDVIVAQQTLGTVVAGYITALGSMWQAVVDVTDLLQTKDMFRIDRELQGTQPFPALPDLEHLPPLPCKHPCSPLPGLHQVPPDGTWPPALPPANTPAMPSAQTRGPGLAPAPVASAPAVAPFPVLPPPAPDQDFPPAGSGQRLPDLHPEPPPRRPEPE